MKKPITNRRFSALEDAFSNVSDRPTFVAGTVQLRFNNLRYNEILGITINICLPQKL